MAESGRLVFANQLRGVAACMVLLAHYTVVVHMLRPAVSWVVGAPPIEGPVPAIARWVAASPIDVGTTAVALFFLISGFVIPFSLERLGSGRFLIARAFRILPTFWVALAIEGALVAASSWYWQRPVPYGWSNYAVNGALLETWVGQQTVDWVSWTLSVEVKFYLLAALCRPWLARRPVALALAWGAVCLGINFGVRTGVISLSPEFVSETIYLPYILIGTMFHGHLAGRLRGATLGGGVVAVLALVTACWWFGPLRGETNGRSLCLLLGVVLFATAYVARGRFRANRLLDGAAAISYPLYLIHSLLGFPILSFLIMAWRVPYEVAAPMTLVSVAAVATGLHMAVEVPSMRVGLALAQLRLWTPRAADARPGSSS